MCLMALSHISVASNSTVAVRHGEEFALGYAFTAAPIRVGERIVVQVGAPWSNI